MVTSRFPADAARRFAAELGIELKVAEERAPLHEQSGFDVRWTHLDSALERVATARILEGIEVTSAHERLGANDYIYAPQARYGDAYKN